MNKQINNKQSVNNFNKKIDIDLNKISIHTPSLCIPRVFKNITEEKIKNIFNNLKLGIIHKIDIKSKNLNNDNFNIVFIHFKKWNTDETTNNTRINFISGKEIKIIYDDPWFWKVSAYRNFQDKIMYLNINESNVKINDFMEEESIVKKEEITNSKLIDFIPRTPSCSPPAISRLRKNNEINNIIT